MRTEIKARNINAITGAAGAVRDVDYDRGFYSTEIQGQIDAPEFVVTGSTIENVISDRRIESLYGRYVIPNIVARDQ